MSIAQDIRFAFRLLLRDRWFTLAGAVALALGIGANATVFTLVNAVLIRGLPFRDSHELMQVWTEDRNGQRTGGVSWEDFEDIRSQSRSFSHLVTSLVASVNVSDGASPPERVSGSYVSWNLFRMLGEQPVLGRDFREEEDRPGGEQVAIIGYTLWQSRYGLDRSVLGRAIRVNSRPVTIIGVMPAGLQFPENVDLWIPRVLLPPGSYGGRGSRNFDVIGRLAPGASSEQARAELAGISDGLAREYAATNKDARLNLASVHENTSDGPIRIIFLAMMGAVGFVLLIACANVANLLLARSIARAREISIRVSIGATRWRIVRQLLIESVLLACLGGAAGFVIAVAAVRWFDRATLNVGKPYWMEFTFDPIVFGFVALVCVGTGVVFGLAPALQVSKTDVNEVLKENGRSGSGGIRARRWAGAFVVSELILTIVLLSGAGFMMRSFMNLYRIEKNIDTSNLLTMQIYLPLTKYPEPDPRRELYQQFEDRLASVPAIQASAVATSPPFGGAMGARLAMDGRMPAEGEPRLIVSVVAVGDRYFEAAGIKLRRGRAFRRDDGTAGHEAVIVNERFVTLHSAGREPLGRQVRLVGPASAWAPIVGIVPNVRQNSVQDREPDPVVYVPLRTMPERATGLLVRTASDAASVMPAIREQMRLVEPDIPLFEVRTMEEQLATERWEYVVFGSMFAAFAAIALVLSAVGVYGVTAFSVTQRTQEIGVRMALGAEPRQILWLMLRRTIVQLAIGLPVGLAGAYGVGRLLEGFLVRTSPADPITLAAIALILVGVALVACLWPARRAARFDPMVALRAD
jgi:predicted permease